MMYSFSWQMVVVMLVVSVGGIMLRKLFSLMQEHKKALEAAMKERFDRIDLKDDKQTASLDRLTEKVQALEVANIERTADMGGRFVRREEHVMALSTIQISLLNMHGKMNQFFEAAK